jgi:thiol-disulfide isomerase/thioredoxin
MRRLLLLFVALLVVTATASPQPLSNKEIALMLRSGYSSESVLLKSPAAARLKRSIRRPGKSLLEFRASPQLIAALESDAYAVSVFRGRKSEAATGRCSPRVASRSPQRTQRPTQPRRTRRLASLNLPPRPSFMRGLRDKLIVFRDGTISRADEAGLENKKLIALYFSAHWCGPCRKFTPQLVEYYNKVAPQHPEFEIISSVVTARASTGKLTCARPGCRGRRSITINSLDWPA